MSISDELMWRYFSLISLQTPAAIRKLRHSVEKGENPRDIKFLLAEELITRFHSKAEAVAAKTAFIEQFSKGSIPDDIQEITVASVNGQLNITNLLKAAGLVPSISEANRMLEQGGVKVDGVKVEDKGLIFNIGEEHILQVGKRKFAKVKVS
jgi:tyrosyl-tRNA synthetase